MLLVLSNGDYLVPPSDNPDANPRQEALWNETWKRINRFQPNLFAELFPEEAGKPPRPRVSRDERVSKDERREVEIAERKGKEVPNEKAEEEDAKDAVKVAEKEG